RTPQPTIGSPAADFIVLRTGEKIDCTILSETDSTLTYKYMLTPKIADTKTIRKTDIKLLTRSNPAQAQFAATSKAPASKAMGDNALVRSSGNTVLRMNSPASAKVQYA